MASEYRHRHIAARGFTLVELAIVMIIVTMLLGTGMTLLSAQIAMSRVKETRSKQEAVREALTNFISRSGRLPCPAVPGLASNVAGYGYEAATPGTCTNLNVSGTAPSQVVTGIVPWNSLGISEDFVRDGYGFLMSFSVALQATNLTLPNVAGMRGVITLHSTAPPVLQSAPTGNQINYCPIGASSSNPCGAVAVLVSHGTEGAGSFIALSASKDRVSTATASADEQANADNDSQFVSHTVSDTFNDIVVAWTPSQLLSPLYASGIARDARSEMNRRFEAIKGALIGSAIASGRAVGPPSSYQLPASLPTLPADILNDVWGNNISYTRVIASITAGTTGTSFSLTSLGEDAANPSDDISYSVDATELAGVFAKTGY